MTTVAISTEQTTRYSRIRASRLATAACSTTIMGAALAVPLAAMSTPAELRGVVLSMSFGAFSTVMAFVGGVALGAQHRRSLGN